MRSSSCALFVAAVLLLRCCQFSEACERGLVTLGETIPKGNIILEHGNPLEIFCVLNRNHRLAQGVNSIHLLFYHNDNLMLPELVSVVNSTTIRMFVEKPPPSISTYLCRLRLQNIAEEATVCLNTVTVALIPRAPVNLSLRNRTSASVCLEWDVAFPMHVFPPGLVNRVQYWSEWDSRPQWMELTTSARDSVHVVVDIKNLTYADARYEFRVTVKSAAAEDVADEMWWSAPASISAKTKPAVHSWPRAARRFGMFFHLNEKKVSFWGLDILRGPSTRKPPMQSLTT